MLTIQELLSELRADGIHDERVLAAIAHVPRERFVVDELREHAYENRALSIPCHQTISQPYIVALMSQAAQLEGHETVLEIGCGSGYQAAILSRLCAHVITIERHAELARQAQQRFDLLGYDNITIHIADGTLGFPSAAPYPAILVTAAAPHVPSPLADQLDDHGRLIIPVGDEDSQQLLKITRINDIFHEEHLCQCRFVKLIGQAAWPQTPT